MESPAAKRQSSFNDSLDSDSEGYRLPPGDDSQSDFEDSADHLLPPVFGLSSPKKAKTSSSSSSEEVPSPAAAASSGVTLSSVTPDIPRVPDGGHTSLDEANEPRTASGATQTPSNTTSSGSQRKYEGKEGRQGGSLVSKLPVRFDEAHSSLNLSSDMSPLKSDISQYRKSAYETRKLYSKGRQLSKALKDKSDKRQKLLEIASGGGIRGMAKKWEDEQQGVSEGSGSYSISQTPSVEFSPTYEPSLAPFKNVTSSSANTPPLPVKPPGRRVFVNPAVTITELYPPGVEIAEEGPFAKLEGNLAEYNPDALREMVCGRWLSLCYQHKPCPHAIRQWLLQLMCLASDEEVSIGAFRSLVSLLQMSALMGKQEVPQAPSLDEIIGVLVSLGAEVSCLLPQKEAVITPQDTDGNDDVFSGPDPPLRKLSRLINYLTAFARAVPGCYTTGELEKLVVMLLSLSLDPTVCGQLIETNIHQCIGVLVAAFPEDCWRDAASRLTQQVLRVSSHHHCRLHMATMFTDLSPRLSQLQERICKASVLQELELSRGEDVVEDERGEGGKASSEHVVKSESQSVNERDQFARKRSFFERVIQHYSNLKQEDIDSHMYSMYSVFLFLSMLIHPSEAQWSSNQERKDFEAMLGQLISARLRDNAFRPERGPVKDLLIRMKLEVSSQRVQGPKQVSIFTMFGSE